MRPECVELVRKVKQLHADAHMACNQFRAMFSQTKVTDEHDGADIAYAFSEMYKWADDTRKQFKQIHELAERVTCLIMVTKGNGDNVKTEFVTASPFVKQMASLPHRTRDPEAFAKLMEFLGVRKDLYDEINGDDEALRPHFPGMVALLTRLQAEGKPLPPGIDATKTYPVYALKLRPKKGVSSTD